MNDVLAGSLSHAPPFPAPKAPTSVISHSNTSSKVPPAPSTRTSTSTHRSLSSIFPPTSPPTKPLSARASTTNSKPAPLRQLARPPLGALFLGPLSNDAEDPFAAERSAPSPSRKEMTAAREPEMSGEGMESLVHTGVDCVRRRKEGAGTARRLPLTSQLSSASLGALSSLVEEFFCHTDFPSLPYLPCRTASEAG